VGSNHHRISDGYADPTPKAPIAKINILLPQDQNLKIHLGLRDVLVNSTPIQKRQAKPKLQVGSHPRTTRILQADQVEDGTTCPILPSISACRAIASLRQLTSELMAIHYDDRCVMDTTTPRPNADPAERTTLRVQSFLDSLPVKRSQRPDRLRINLTEPLTIRLSCDPSL